MRVKFRVFAWWKGGEESSVWIVTPIPVNCGYKFTFDVVYLVLAEPTVTTVGL